MISSVTREKGQISKLPRAATKVRLKRDLAEKQENKDNS